MVKSGLALSQGCSDFSFLRLIYTRCAGLHSCVPSAHPPQEDALLSLVLLLTAILTQEMDSKAVLLRISPWPRVEDAEGLFGYYFGSYISFLRTVYSCLSSLIDRIILFVFDLSLKWTFNGIYILPK